MCMKRLVTVKATQSRFYLRACIKPNSMTAIITDDADIESIWLQTLHKFVIWTSLKAHALTELYLYFVWHDDRLVDIKVEDQFYLACKRLLPQRSTFLFVSGYQHSMSASTIVIRARNKSFIANWAHVSFTVKQIHVTGADDFWNWRAHIIVWVICYNGICSMFAKQRLQWLLD